jgi:hypothetical protein
MKKEKVGVLPDNSGLLSDIEEKLSGSRSAYWQMVYGRVSRGENPFDIPKDFAERWKVFYIKFFGITCNFSKIPIPETNREGFDEIMFIPGGITLTEVVKVYNSTAYIICGLDGNPDWFRFFTSLKFSPGTTFEDHIISYERSKNSSYAVRVSNHVWQDEFEGMKYSELQTSCRSLIDPLEYLLYDIYFMWCHSEGILAMHGDVVSYGTAVCPGAVMGFKKKNPVYPVMHFNYHPGAYFRWDGLKTTQKDLEEFTLSLNLRSLSRADKTVALEVIAL